MPVQEFFYQVTFSGSSFLGTSTTIQPSVGTIYSFNRGVYISNINNPNYLRIKAFSDAGTSNLFYVNGSSTFSRMWFSESGTHVVMYSDSSAVMYIVNLSSHPFTAISNSNKITLQNTYTLATTSSFTAVGVSMT